MFKLFILLAILPSLSFAGAYQNDYEVVAASQSNQKLGPTGGVGDVIKRLIIVPETTGAGNVSIRDGSGLAGTEENELG